MLLRVGVIMMLFSLTLAAGAAATVVGYRNAAPETTTVSSMEPQAAEAPAKPEKQPNRSEKLQIEDDEPAPQPRPKEPKPRPKAPEPRPKAPEPRPKAPEPRPQPPPRLKPPPIQNPEPRPSTPAPLPVADLPQPTSEEQTSAQEPRYYEPEPGMQMSLTVEALGLYSVPVTSSDDLSALDAGLMHVPETSLPWDQGPHRNVFVAGHYLGYPGTNSRLVFYNLDRLREGDEVVVEDGRGRAYEYRVSESFSARPEESWVMGQELGKDMLTLQTCIPPGFEERLIIRADRV